MEKQFKIQIQMLCNSKKMKKAKDRIYIKLGRIINLFTSTESENDEFATKHTYLIDRCPNLTTRDEFLHDSYLKNNKLLIKTELGRIGEGEGTEYQRVSSD
jgi:hypothetical protein